MAVHGGTWYYILHSITVYGGTWRYKGCGTPPHPPPPCYPRGEALAAAAAGSAAAGVTSRQPIWAPPAPSAGGGAAAGGGGGVRLGVGVSKRFGIRLGEEAALDDDLGLWTSGGTWNLEDRRCGAGRRR